VFLLSKLRCFLDTVVFMIVLLAGTYYLAWVVFVFAIYMIGFLVFLVLLFVTSLVFFLALCTDFLVGV
jgi:hypothetical protein